MKETKWIEESLKLSLDSSFVRMTKIENILIILRLN